MAEPFDVDALYDAMDRRRTERGLSWAAVAREISAGFDGAPGRPVATSSITGMRDRVAISCQHALLYADWLGVPLETFVPGSTITAAPPPATDRRHLPRWDLRSLAAALDDERQRRGLTWAQVSAELGCSAAQASGVAKATMGSPCASHSRSPRGSAARRATSWS